MKRLWIAAALLSLTLGASLWHSHRLETFTTALADQLAQAETLALSGENRRAEELIRQAREQWLARNTYLHVTLRHGDTDQIQIGFDEALQLLRTGELGEYAAASAHLMADLKLLTEAEQLTLENLF